MWLYVLLFLIDFFILFSLFFDFAYIFLFIFIIFHLQYFLLSEFLLMVYSLNLLCLFFLREFFFIFLSNLLNFSDIQRLLDILLHISYLARTFWNLAICFLYRLEILGFILLYTLQKLLKIPISAFSSWSRITANFLLFFRFFKI